MMFIDHRENDWVKNHSWDFPTQVEQLPVGDLLIKGGIAIERKEINDFVSSMNQRLWEQLIDLEENIEDDSNSYEVAILLIHGTVADLSSYNMEPRKIEAIYGSISRILISYSVPVIWVRERSQVVKVVNKLYAKGGTESERVKPHLTKRRYRDDRLNVLAGIHGCGRKTCTDILEEFETVANVANASVRDLQRVDGVGPKTAEAIHEVFHEQPG